MVDYWMQFWMSCFAEFMGVLVLVLLGNGVIACTHYKRMIGNQPGKHIQVVVGWGLAIFLSVLINKSMGGYGQLNPAVTSMEAITATKLNFNELSLDPTYIKNAFFVGYQALNVSASAGIFLTWFIFIMFQFLGAMTAQIILNFLTYKFITDRENDIFTVRTCHSTSPVYKNKEDKAALFNFSFEFVGTCILAGVVLAFGSDGFVENVPTSTIPSAFASIPASLLVASLIVSLGAATGYALNPARDFGPRIIFHYTAKVLRKEDVSIHDYAEWSYSWVPLLAPWTAGILIGCFGLI